MAEKKELTSAVQWISESLKDNPDQHLLRLVDQATFKFNLSPKDGEFLIKFFHTERKGKKLR